MSGSVLLAWVGLVGCGPQDHDVFEIQAVDRWEQAPTNQVDILWVIDDSPSMLPHQAAIADGFSSFIEQIEATLTDFHIGVITMSFDADDAKRGQLVGDPAVITNDTPDYTAVFQDHVHVGAAGSSKERAFESMQYALSPAMLSAPNAGFLRPDADLLVVFVSDEDDCSDNGAFEGVAGGDVCYDRKDLLVPIERYVDPFWAIKDDDPTKLQVSMIVGDLDHSCDYAARGDRYITLANWMGGLVHEVCTEDYSQIMYELGLNASGVITAFRLSGAAQPDTIEVTIGDVDGNELVIPADAANGWTYDETTLYLTFHGDGIPPRGSTISAKYTRQAS
jgi:hypothetical protein